MQFSAPVYKLKRRAKLIARSENTPLHKALDTVAAEEGFQSWSHLASAAQQDAPAIRLLKTLDAGDLMLLGARPGQGKTLLGIEIAAAAIDSGKESYFFTLDYNPADVQNHIDGIEAGLQHSARAIKLDTSDNISADHILNKLNPTDSEAVVVIDYLQLLDQKRSNPALNTQVRKLRAYAKDCGAIFVFVSQIDRTFDASSKEMPDLCDVRLPNPLDLDLFDKCFFLHNGKVQMGT